MMNRAVTAEKEDDDGFMGRIRENRALRREEAGNVSHPDS